MPTATATATAHTVHIYNVPVPLETIYHASMGFLFGASATAFIGSTFSPQTTLKDLQSPLLKATLLTAGCFVAPTTIRYTYNKTKDVIKSGCEALGHFYQAHPVISTVGIAVGSVAIYHFFGAKIGETIKGVGANCLSSLSRKNHATPRVVVEAGQRAVESVAQQSAGVLVSAAAAMAPSVSAPMPALAPAPIVAAPAPSAPAPVVVAPAVSAPAPAPSAPAPAVSAQVVGDLTVSTQGPSTP